MENCVYITPLKKKNLYFSFEYDGNHFFYLKKKSFNLWYKAEKDLYENKTSLLNLDILGCNRPVLVTSQTLRFITP